MTCFLRAGPSIMLVNVLVDFRVSSVKCVGFNVGQGNICACSSKSQSNSFSNTATGGGYNCHFACREKSSKPTIIAWTSFSNTATGSSGLVTLEVPN